MATFEAQVEALTGLTISSSATTPTQAELTQFLKDGVVEVINKIIERYPQDIPKFCNSTHDDSDAGITITGRIVSVVREHDSTSILRPCTPINAPDRYEATDSTSLKYRSKYNPGYYILDKKVYSVPASAGNNNDIIVTQVHYDQTVAYGSDDMQHYPTEYIYLVPLYAAIKSLEAQMAEYTITEEDYELATSMELNLDALKDQYDSALGIPSKSSGKSGVTQEQLQQYLQQQGAK